MNNEIKVNSVTAIKNKKRARAKKSTSTARKKVIVSEIDDDLVDHSNNVDLADIYDKIDSIEDNILDEIAALKERVLALESSMYVAKTDKSDRDVQKISPHSGVVSLRNTFSKMKLEMSAGA